LLAAGMIYVFTTVGIGLLVSTITRTQVAALLMALVLTIMPSFLFSGFIYPIHTMPRVLQLYSTSFPAMYFTDISRAIVLKGSDLTHLGQDFAILFAYTAAIISLAAWRFKKKVG